MIAQMFRQRFMILIGAICSFFVSVPAFAQNSSCSEWAKIGFVPTNENELFYSVQHANIYAKKKSEIRQAALAEIATQIKAQVTTVIESELGQIQNTIRRRYEETVRTISNATFYGDDLHEESCFDATKNTYWFYVYITKADFEKRMAERKKMTIMKTQDRFQSGLSAERSGEDMLALDNYWAALKEMRDFCVYPMRASGQGREVLLNSAVPNRFQTLAGSIYLEPEAKTFTYKLSQPKKPVFRAYFLQGQKKHPVISLPVVFSVQNNLAKIQARGSTDAQGKVSCLIEKAKWSAEGIRLLAKIDWRGRFPDTTLLELYNIKMDTARFAFADVFLASPLLHLQISFQSISANLRYSTYSMNILRGSIVEYLTGAVNARFTENARNADRQLKVLVNAAPIRNPYGMRSVRTTLLLQLLDPRTQKVIFAPKSISTTKAALSDNQALELTLENLAEELGEELLPVVVERLGG